jgi:hypothetical protein
MTLNDLIPIAIPAGSLFTGWVWCRYLGTNSERYEADARQRRAARRSARRARHARPVRTPVVYQPTAQALRIRAMLEKKAR